MLAVALITFFAGEERFNSGTAHIVVRLSILGGWLLLLILLPFIQLFHARYLCMLFDSAGTA